MATMFFALLFSNSATAQEKSSFLGKWDTTVMGTPNGDSKMIFEIVEKEGKLAGNALNPVTNEVFFPFTKVEEEPNKLTVYFTINEYEIHMYLKKKDADNLEGSAMDKFDAKATRIKS